jgi:hypothetical protein
LEWLEKAANQNNPRALYWLGDWFRLSGGIYTERAVSYYQAAATLEWKDSMYFLAYMLKTGSGCPKDLNQAVIWSVKGGKEGYGTVFLEFLGEGKRAFEEGTTQDLDGDFDQLCYALGLGLYWYQNEMWANLGRSHKAKLFRSHCLDHYCSCVELPQESIFAFLLCWNRATGVKGLGQVIAQMVWEGRETNLLRKFEEKRDGKGLQCFFWKIFISASLPTTPPSLGRS